MAVYDDEKQKPNNPGEHDDLGVHPERAEAEAEDLENKFNAPSTTDEDLPEGHPSRSDRVKPSSPEQLKAAEVSAAEEPGTIGGGYKKYDKPNKREIFSLLKRNRKKLWVGGGIVGVMALISVLLFFLALPFKLQHFMENVQLKAFGRYQVDMNGRSSKWLNAYLILRFSEIEDPNIAPKDRDNIFFRSERVDNNQPIRDWFRTLRTSKFEQELFEKRGIKFTSYATYDTDRNFVRFRPAILSIDGEAPIKFNVTSEERVAIEKLDVSRLNGRLSELINVQELSGNKAARKKLADILKEERPGWWRAYARYFHRKNIQNMIGVRNWRFFETRRDDLREKRISIRNKIIINSFPSSNIVGRFVQCLFGLGECKASSDAADPNSQALPDTGKQKEGSKTGDTDGDPDTPNASYSDGSEVEILDNGLRAAASEVGEETVEEATETVLAKFIRKEILSKVNPATSIASFIDMFARLDKALQNKSLSKMVTLAKGAQAVGLYTVFAVASDQMKSGEITGEETAEFMKEFGNPTNSEGWSTVIDPSSAGKVAAATDSGSFTFAKDRAEFCSIEHQAEIDKPQNRSKAEQEFQYLCPQYKVGADGNNANALEEAWRNSAVGKMLHPLLAAYNSTVGKIFDVVTKIAGAVLDPIVQGITKALGVDDNIENIIAWAAEKALGFFGAGPMINENTPSGQVANVVLEGGAVTSESSMRMQGAALTTDESRASALRNYFAYQQENNSSIRDRYFSLENPRSLVSRQLFALSNSSVSSLAKNFGNMLGRIFSAPLQIFSSKSQAASDDPYAAAKFTGIETYDYPDACLESDPLAMTPEDATNADDLGYFTAAELNWTLLTDYEDWYAKLYEKVGDDENKAKKVWNCALFDDAVRGSIGGLYGYKGVNAL